LVADSEGGDLQQGGRKQAVWDSTKFYREQGVSAITDQRGRGVVKGYEPDRIGFMLLEGLGGMKAQWKRWRTKA